MWLNAFFILIRMLFVSFCWLTSFTAPLDFVCAQKLTVHAHHFFFCLFSQKSLSCSVDRNLYCSISVYLSMHICSANEFFAEMFVLNTYSSRNIFLTSSSNYLAPVKLFILVIIFCSPFPMLSLATNLGARGSRLSAS